jgi:hypothetical protein
MSTTYDGNANPSLNGTAAAWKTIKVPAGTTSAVFLNLNYVYIDASATIYTGQCRYSGLKNFKILNETFQNVSGGACRLWEGNAQNGFIQGGKFTNCGVVNELEDKNRPYVGTIDSLVMYNVTFADEVAEKSDMYWLGTYAGGWEPKGYCYKVNGMNIQTNNTKSNGTQWRGTIFGYNLTNCVSNYTINGGINPILGDVGMFYLTGYGNIDKCAMYGGRGYIGRLWISWFYLLQNGVKTLTGVDTYLTNGIKANTNTYGGWDIRPTEQVGEWNYRGGNVHTENHTMHDCVDSIGYWCPVNVIGDCSQDHGRVMRVFSKNHIGANLFDSTKNGVGANKGKDPINFQQASNANWNKADASGSQYFDVTSGHIDPVTHRSLIAGIGATLADGTIPGTGVTTPPVTTPPTTGGTTTTPTNPLDAQVMVQFNFTSGNPDTFRYLTPKGKTVKSAKIEIDYSDGTVEKHTATSPRK